jgi:hypothetical protein
MEIMQGEIKIRKKKQTRTEHNETDHSRERRPFNPEGGWSGKTGDMDHALSCAEKKRDDKRRGAGEKI